MTNIGLCSDNEGFPGSKKIDNVVVEEDSKADFSGKASCNECPA